jgi:RNA polymerase sigma factor (sigma-70 family)
MELPHDPTFDAAFDDLFAVAKQMAYRVAGAAWAEDVAAEVLGRTFARWPRVKDLPYRRAWVAKVAFNEALDVTRRERRHVDVSAVNGSQRDVADDATTRVALNDAIARLPKRQREVVALRYLADLGEADTASALGISVGSVKQHARRGLESMRGQLDLETVLGRRE